MNRLVIIGNGFDMAHGLKTSYMDFINWYWDCRVNSFIEETTKVSEDCLCRLKIKDNSDISCWNVFAFNNSYFIKSLLPKSRYTGSEVVQYIKDNPVTFSIECCLFFETILQSIENRGWVDIENDYYQLLKISIANPNCGYTINELNSQLAYLQSLLVKYLGTIETNNFRNDLKGARVDYVDTADFSTESTARALDNLGLDYDCPRNSRYYYENRNNLKPERIMLLSFNYTGTAQMYDGDNFELNYIHGDLEHPENIIFGYGDELDKSYQDILDKNNNEFLRNVKSVKYLETRHYHDLLEFLMSAPFQVLIMGHSCGNSDRTLLNTVFEHENCVSIKPFYHKWDDGRDNYLELVQNISRNFTNMKLFRDRVVNKEQCQTM